MKSKAERSRDIERAEERLQRHGARWPGMLYQGDGIWRYGDLLIDARPALIDGQLWARIVVTADYGTAPPTLRQIDRAALMFLGDHERVLIVRDLREPSPSAAVLFASLEQDPLPAAVCAGVGRSTGGDPA